MVTDNIERDVKETKELIRLRNCLVHDVTERIESFSLNTLISAFMEYNNKFVEMTNKGDGVDKETLITMVKLIAPFAPHMGEELFEMLGGTYSVFDQEWPTYDESKLVSDTITVPVQINGKTRVTVDVALDIDKDSAIAVGKEALGNRLDGLNIIKEIYVPKKIINIVAK